MWLEVMCNISRDGVEETMRDASCFVSSFLVNDQLHFPKEVSESNPLFVHQSLPNLSIKISYSAYKYTQDNQFNGTHK